MNKLKINLGMIALAAILLVPGGKAVAVNVPVITILGSNPATVSVGGTYTDAGATAVDGFGTPINDSITTTGLPVSTATAGTFVVTYTVNITDGDTPVSAVATRTVNVVAPAVTTNPASSITTNDATLNGTLGASAASNVSFWVSTSTFSVATPDMPAGVYSTPVLGAVAANGTFATSTSVVTTAGITTGGALVNMPPITPSTTYYYVAWAYIDGTWTHGEIVSFQTASAIPPESATLILVKHTIGGDATFNFTLTGSTSTSTAISTDGGYATTTITLNVGTTTISEESKTGWTLTGKNCIYDNESIGNEVAGTEVINVDNGDVVTCTFTNTSNTVGTIKVIKNVLASDGSTDVVDNHSFNVTLGGETTKAFAENNIATFEGLSTGIYTITEGSDSDYDLVSISGDVDSETPGVQVAVVAGLTNTITITNKQHATTTVTTTEGSTPPRHVDGQTGGGGQSVGTGSVLGASTDTSPSGKSCKIALNSFLRRGKKNDPEEVKKLQEFLNSENLGVTIPVTGFFGPQTDKAVRAFQLKYAKDILGPWGTDEATGYVFKTTLRWINHLRCMKDPLPPVTL